jgi:hypothetical protein
MDRVSEYRKIVQQLIVEYARYRPLNGAIESEAIMDSTRDRYEVVHVGWDGHRRVHGSVIHIDIIDGKVWIQHNGTDQLIAEELVQLGIPAEHIVLDFQPPNLRKHTGFAVA